MKTYLKITYLLLFGFVLVACKQAKKTKEEVLLPKILGGEAEYDISKVPWQVGLLSSKEANTCFCGGSIINKKWILTAAHCLYDDREDGTFERKKAIYIFANSSVLNEKGQVYEVKNIIENTSYNHLNKDNDIALIELVEPIDIQYENQIIKIPNEEEYENLYKVDEEVFVSGWGAVFEDGKGLSDVLMKASVSFKEHSICSQNYRDEGGLVTDNMICASGIYSDSCLGDSGGPLFTIVDGKGIQLGITSWGSFPCANPDLYGVYTNVFKYREWINENCSNCIDENLIL